mmetsp:Transcript_20458/g.41607  ORF Transcript_20458/g.41607 Transcript_20458/m.41607 type:complete len:216 (+) Transcript_20458:3-650(+)|eukprot:CAMPEP_0181303634 /NCGR_PEP_ID=MMETSP1101-20121128/8671_1 /TAXON_ID=46948 /ORGANISM="Rhodomonas abbreviata, Strain Caron Lab Isolate" /LENGTH=215 /DNA_ID=CAMNT_0023409237 /DNA_START=18 /DNA_END=665 /DNA_ORIENTATION=-
MADDAERHGLVAPHRIVYVNAGSSPAHVRSQNFSRGWAVVGLLGLAMCAALVMLGSNTEAAPALAKQPVALGEIGSQFQKLDEPEADDDSDSDEDDDDDEDAAESDDPHPPNCADAKVCLKSCLLKASLPESDVDKAMEGAKGYAECFINTCEDKQLPEGEKCELDADEFDECWDSLEDFNADLLNSMETCTVSITGEDKLKIDKYLNMYSRDLD